MYGLYTSSHELIYKDPSADYLRGLRDGRIPWQEDAMNWYVREIRSTK